VVGVTRSTDIVVDGHYGIGPYTDVYGHGPVTGFVEPDSEGWRFVACLDCGAVTDDIRRLIDVECDRSSNHIAQTWRERIGDAIDERVD